MAVRYAECHPNKYHKARGLCGACWTKRWRVNNPAKALEMSRRCEAKRKGIRKYKKRVSTFNHADHISKTFGLTLAQYNTMLAKQNGVCAICELPETRRGLKRLAVDHNHETGVVRGLLCSTCNMALGKFKDSVELIGRALSYLKESTYV